MVAELQVVLEMIQGVTDAGLYVAISYIVWLFVSSAMVYAVGGLAIWCICQCVNNITKAVKERSLSYHKSRYGHE